MQASAASWQTAGHLGDHIRAIRASFALVTHLVYGGLWNLLEVALAGVWWIGFGVALRPSHGKLAWATILTGVFPLCDGLASMLGLVALHEALLDLYLVASIAWPITIGAVLLRDGSRAGAKGAPP